MDLLGKRRVMLGTSLLLMSLMSAIAQTPASNGQTAATPATAQGTGPQSPARRGPAAFDFADNNGFTSLFDGSLKGWDFDKGLWDIQDGAIHIAATCEKPTGTVYAITDTGEYGDFILKYEMKGTGNINGGMQFRSYIAADPAAAGTRFPARQRPAGGVPPSGFTGQAGTSMAPGRPPACANPGIAPTRASQAKWDMAGPQVDFDRNNNFSGMNYEQGGRGIIARPGYALYADSDGVKSLAQIATKDVLDSWFHKDDWNQFVVVALGHSTSIFLNGHMVTQMIDNDSRFFRSSGKIGIESEATGDLWVRAVSVKKLN
ncbi:3-keto-disaccharide hydrolase [Terriglobus roseus]|uniref:3-keto-alpha-glucoside-1,2-lyase/3-keto-2-hydroxy-glucal hydratase domain-containing protein n=1 Tax=Terriglobus roseus TaxID=392734 RepID=A0A1H4JXG5_9BACT|nr:DUF1080 domain-containing protein [Terriglobus roseus]SEB50837.1 protein of unknown function [Terriglobus roseus]